jgi:hypothetical protein
VGLADISTTCILEAYLVTNLQKYAASVNQTYSEGAVVMNILYRKRLSDRSCMQIKVSSSVVIAISLLGFNTSLTIITGF